MQRRLNWDEGKPLVRMLGAPKLFWHGARSLFTRGAGQTRFG